GFGWLSGGEQRSGCAHRYAEQCNSILGMSFVEQKAGRGFSIAPLVVPERDHRVTAVAVVARIVQQRAVTEAPEIDGALEQLAARSEQPVRVDDRALLASAGKKPAADPYPVRGLKLHILVLRAVVGWCRSQPAIQRSGTSSGDQ